VAPRNAPASIIAALPTIDSSDDELAGNVPSLPIDAVDNAGP
jgi:hypothetical protein